MKNKCHKAVLKNFADWVLRKKDVGTLGTLYRLVEPRQGVLRGGGGVAKVEKGGRLTTWSIVSWLGQLRIAEWVADLLTEANKNRRLSLVVAV